MKNVLRNCWYMAAWGAEISDQPLARRILDTPVAFFRDTQGGMCALSNTCPHRFAPLAKGRLLDGVIECPYHGLRFDGKGKCVGAPLLVKDDLDVTVQTFPVAERDGIVWVWMGDAAAATIQAPPDFSFLRHNAHIDLLELYMRQESNFFLGIDNLMDPSHTAFLHRATLSQGTDYFRQLFSQAAYACRKLDGGRISSEWSFRGEDGSYDPTETFEALWFPPTTVIQRSKSRLILGEKPADGAFLHFGHILTPESENSAHYFAFETYDRRDKDAAYLTERGRLLKEAVFLAEDDPILADIDKEMAGRDLFSMNPIILPADAAAVQVRLSYAKMLEAERA